MNEVFVYVFSGMLESGKTSFLRKSMETLPPHTHTLLITGEYEEQEYSNLGNPDISIIYLKDLSELTSKYQNEFDKTENPSQVFIEQNSMWTFNELANALPNNWQLFQCICIIDARTFTLYLRNMPELMMDKIRNSSLILFNRCTPALALELHKHNLRMLNRKAGIYLEFTDGSIEDYRQGLNDIFDMSGDIVYIPDDEFGMLFVDILERVDCYINKKIRFKGMIHYENGMGDNFAVGRISITCCEQDMVYCGLCCEPISKEIPEVGTWVEVTGFVKKAYQEFYGTVGPVIVTNSILATEIPASAIISY